METRSVVIVIFAIVAALGLAAVPAIETYLIQQANAQGCSPGSHPFNASKGRCFKG